MTTARKTPEGNINTTKAINFLEGRIHTIQLFRQSMITRIEDMIQSCQMMETLINIEKTRGIWMKLKCIGIKVAGLEDTTMVINTRGEMTTTKEILEVEII